MTKQILTGRYRALKRKSTPGFEWSACVDVVQCDRPNEYMVTRVFVPREHRREGIATELMRELLADADAIRATVFIAPLPYHEAGNISKRALTKFYKRLGFVVIAGEGFMRRRPHRDGVEVERVSA